MTCRERMLAIRMIDKMEKMNQAGMSCVTKDEDGTLKYTDKEGRVLVEAKMVKRS